MNQKQTKVIFKQKFLDKYKDLGVTEKTEHWHENGTNYEGICFIIKNPRGEDIRLMYEGNHVGSGEIILSCSRWHLHAFDFCSPAKDENGCADYFLEYIGGYIEKIIQGADL